MRGEDERRRAQQNRDRFARRNVSCQVFLDGNAAAESPCINHAAAGWQGTDCLLDLAAGVVSRKAARTLKASEILRADRRRNGRCFIRPGLRQSSLRKEQAEQDEKKGDHAAAPVKSCVTYTPSKRFA